MGKKHWLLYLCCGWSYAFAFAWFQQRFGFGVLVPLLLAGGRIGACRLASHKQAMFSKQVAKTRLMPEFALEAVPKNHRPALRLAFTAAEEPFSMVWGDPGATAKRQRPELSALSVDPGSSSLGPTSVEPMAYGESSGRC